MQTAWMVGKYTLHGVSMAWLALPIEEDWFCLWEDTQFSVPGEAGNIKSRWKMIELSVYWEDGKEEPVSWFSIISYFFPEQDVLEKKKKVET